MKRIALVILLGFLVASCDNPIDPDTGTHNENSKQVSLKIHVPPRNATSYAGEDASASENRITVLFIDLYQAGSLIHKDTISGTDLNILPGHLDSIINVSYEVDNITTGTLEVEVFANWDKPLKITTEIPAPSPSNSDKFYMSGRNALTFNGVAYIGEVHVVRNVAKLRVLISKNTVVVPSDLIIDYDNVEISIINAPDSTTAFGGVYIDATSIGYINYPARTTNALRKGPLFDNNPPPLGTGGTGAGGLIDSLYLYENLRSNYTSPSDRKTKVIVSIPTRSVSEGNKTATNIYEIETLHTNFGVLRNYIYTLDIRVRGQNLDPLIALDIEPWNDVPVNGSILGTYLRVDNSEIVFNPLTGLAFINFCTDAQAIYFDFTEFNGNNTPQLGAQIKPIGIDTTFTSAPGGFSLAPDGFKDAQILVDQQHCGTFGFELDQSYFTDPSSINFGGKICIRAGNIVKCLNFPARLTYDAHFIVGEPLFPGEEFTHATVSPQGSWIEVSPNRLYTNDAVSVFNNGSIPVPLYLHLNEFLPTMSPDNLRSGSVTLSNYNTGVEKVIYISQLNALPVGRFGYNNTSSLDDSIYTANLYMEQLKEYGSSPASKPIFAPSGSPLLPNNALYNGRYPAINMTSVFANTWYNDATFDYTSAIYQAINYCAYKNRSASRNGTLVASDIKWYLPSQAQLMAMWISFESYKDHASSNFYNGTSYPDIFWSATNNPLYVWQSQHVDFRYGNVGHYNSTQGNWVRCVRDGETLNSIVQTGSSSTAHFYFGNGLPATAHNTTSKNGVSGDETSINNQKLYSNLRIATSDLNNGALSAWSLNLCNTYSETGATSGWRLPTQRELQALWILQHEIKDVVPAFNLLYNEYYWSGTDAKESLGTNAWTIYGSGSRTLLGGSGNAPHQHKATLLRVRCVYEMP